MCALLTGINLNIGKPLLQGSDQGAYAAGTLQDFGTLHCLKENEVVDSAIVELQLVTLDYVYELDVRHPGVEGSPITA
jgi:hypothetical protein